MRANLTPQRPLGLRRRRMRVERLESRRLLAAGLLQLETTVPISQTGQPTIAGSAQIGADIVLLDPSDLSALSVTNTTAVGSGTIDGQIDLFGTGFLQEIDGTFVTDPQPPSVQITSAGAGQLRVVAQQSGTFTVVIQLVGQRSGTFTTTIDGILDLQTGAFSGAIQLTLEGSGFDSQQTIPFDEIGTLPPGTQAPDPILPSVADRVFHDADLDGLQDIGEAGVAGVGVRLLASDGNSQALLETTVSDVDGFYAFYNLAPGDYVVQFDQLPAGYDLTRWQAGNLSGTDSDPSSLTGRTGVLTLAAGVHRRDVDAGLRMVANAWQSPNEPADVDDDGVVQPIDALKIINRLNRRDQSSDLSGDRPLGSLFYDVDGSGDVTAADALRVINFLNRRSRGGEGEGDATPTPPFPTVVDMLLPGILDAEQQRRRNR